MAETRWNKRPKSYYSKSTNKQFRNAGRELNAGMKGFLVTCNWNERDCTREAYQLLNEYADKLYGPTQDSEKDDSDQDDLDLALKKEVLDLKYHKKWRFHAVKSGANNVVFISTEIDDPCEMVHHILTDLHQTKKLRSRFVLRLLPISGTCKTQEEKMEKLAEEVVSPHFEFTCRSYMYAIKIRSNSAIKRMNMMHILDSVMHKHEDLNHRVDMENPDLVVLVEVIRNICCMSVLKDFKKFKKYNLHSVVEASTLNEKKTDEVVGKKTDEGVGEKTDKVVGEKTDEVVGEKTEEGVGEETDEVVGEKTDEGVGEETDKVVGEKTDKVVGEKTDKVVGEKTDEVVGEKTDEGVGEKTDEVVGEKTDEGVGEKTDEEKTDEVVGEKTYEVVQEETDEVVGEKMVGEKTDEVVQEETDEVGEKTDEVVGEKTVGEKTDDVVTEKTHEVVAEKTHEIVGEKTDEVVGEKS